MTWLFSSSFERIADIKFINNSVYFYPQSDSFIVGASKSDAAAISKE